MRHDAPKPPANHAFVRNAIVSSRELAGCRRLPGGGRS
jgi:hypothetical protein